MGLLTSKSAGATAFNGVSSLLLRVRGFLGAFDWALLLPFSSAVKRGGDFLTFWTALGSVKDQLEKVRKIRVKSKKILDAGVEDLGVVAMIQVRKLE